MRTILINALSIKMGGGLIVLRNLLAAFQKNNNISLVVIADEVVSQQLPASNNTLVLTFPWIKKGALHFLYWHEFILPSLISKFQIDVFFSQTNFLPFRKLKCPSLLLLHHAGYFSLEYKHLYLKQHKSFKNRLAWAVKTFWIKASIKKSNMLTVQTQALADAIIQEMHFPANRIQVIPHGPGLAQGEVKPKTFPQSACWRIGYITKLGVQKDFETLFAALQQLKAKQKQFQLVLTLDVKDLLYSHIEQLIKNYGLETEVINYGESGYQKVRELYQSLDLFIFPSLCESFGFTLLEAMYYGIPILAADTASNREILANDDGLFESTNADRLAEKIMTLITNQDFYKLLSRHSLSRIQAFSWSIAAENLIKVIHQIMEV